MSEEIARHDWWCQECSQASGEYVWPCRADVPLEDRYGHLRPCPDSPFWACVTCLDVYSTSRAIESDGMCVRCLHDMGWRTTE